MKAYFKRTWSVHVLLFLLCSVVLYAVYLRDKGSPFSPLLYFETAWSVYLVVILPVLTVCLFTVNSLRLGHVDCYLLISVEVFLLLGFFAINGFSISSQNFSPLLALLIASVPTLITALLGIPISNSILKKRRKAE